MQRHLCNGCKRTFTIPYESSIEDGETDESFRVEAGSVLNYEYAGKIRLHGLTDIHVGANEHDDEKLKEAVKAIKKDKFARWFGNGDLIECIPPNYKIPQRGQSMSPDDQYEVFIKMFRPIADKCLFIRGGNHDYLRSIKVLDFDISRGIANALEVPYFELPGYTTITTSGRSWNLVSGHGTSGGKNGDLELDKMAAVYSDGDIFFLGHNHQLYVKPIDSIIIDEGEETLHRRWYIRGGSFLRYANYARYAMYPIVRTGWVTMELDGKEANCWVN
jgi:predicted phosphodiesterase